MNHRPTVDCNSVTLDDAGNVWYTGNRNATIGKFDPNTGEITVDKMPDPAARDPHTAVFDVNGILRFTLQHGNRVGRPDPAIGDIRLVRMKTPESKPYGIRIHADGAPWIACNGSNCLARLGRAAMAFTAVELPVPESAVRRLDIANDGMVWCNESGMRPDTLVRFGPETEKFQSWPIPSGGVYAGIGRHMRLTQAGNLLIYQFSTNRTILVTLK